MSKKIFDELEKINKEILNTFSEFGWIEWKKYENDLAYPFWKTNIAGDDDTADQFKKWSDEIMAKLMKQGKNAKVEPKSDVKVEKRDNDFSKFESIITETSALIESAVNDDSAVALVESSLAALTSEYAALDPNSDDAKSVKAQIEAQLGEWMKKYSY